MDTARRGCYIPLVYWFGILPDGIKPPLRSSVLARQACAVVSRACRGFGHAVTLRCGSWGDTHRWPVARERRVRSRLPWSLSALLPVVGAFALSRYGVWPRCRVRLTRRHDCPVASNSVVIDRTQRPLSHSFSARLFASCRRGGCLVLPLSTHPLPVVGVGSERD